MATPTKTTAARKPPAPKAAAQPTARSAEQHLATVAAGDVLSPQGLYEFMEALRSLTSMQAFYVHAAASQLEAALRKGARDEADGRLTLRQKVELAKALRRISRLLNRECAEDLLACATSAVRAYAVMEDFLESLESDSVQRPHRNSRGGFDPFAKS